MRTVRLHLLLFVMIVGGFLFDVGPASAQAGIRRPDVRQRAVVEADLLVAFGEHLGRAPLIAPGAGIEFGLGRFVGVSVGGFAAVATPRALTFFDETGVGGGWSSAARLYIRGSWPRGFGVGAAMGMMVVEGVAVATPRLELFYRFLVASHLALRLTGVVGGLFLWDTAVGDRRPGPSEEDAVGGRISGFLLGVGISIGWSSEVAPTRAAPRGG